MRANYHLIQFIATTGTQSMTMKTTFRCGNVYIFYSEPFWILRRLKDEETLKSYYRGIILHVNYHFNKIIYLNRRSSEGIIFCS